MSKTDMNVVYDALMNALDANGMRPEEDGDCIIGHVGDVQFKIAIENIEA